MYIEGGGQKFFFLFTKSCVAWFNMVPPKIQLGLRENNTCNTNKKSFLKDPALSININIIRTSKVQIHHTVHLCLSLYLSLTDKLFAWIHKVLMFDGNAEHVAHASRKIDLFGEKKYIRVVTALDLIKRLEQNKKQILLLKCAPIAALLSDISTM